MILIPSFMILIAISILVTLLVLPISKQTNTLQNKQIEIKEVEQETELYVPNTIWGDHAVIYSVQQKGYGELLIKYNDNRQETITLTQVNLPQDYSVIYIYDDTLITYNAFQNEGFGNVETYNLTTRSKTGEFKTGWETFEYPRVDMITVHKGKVLLMKNNKVTQEFQL